MSMAQQLLNRFLLWWNPPKDNCENEYLENFISRWESCLMKFQKVLIWENPVVSLICIAFVNIIFWSVVYLEWRLYGLFFFSLLLVVIADWARQQGLVGACRAPTTLAESPTESSPTYRILNVEEICSCVRGTQSKTRAVCTKLRDIRQQQPATFCLLTCCCCLALGLVGRAASGAAIIYGLLMSVLTAPGLCVRYPQVLTYLFGSISFTVSDSEGDEYLPESSVGTMRILSLVEEIPEQPPSQDLLQALETPAGDASLYPDLSLMPSHDSHSLDFLDPDTELPSPRQIDQDLSDGSDLSEPHEIQFKTRHFNGDGSSTSSGEELARGLRFRGNLRRDASSDSSGSFELISKDDL